MKFLNIGCCLNKELEKALSKFLEKERYIKFTFEKPSIDRHGIIPLTVQNADDLRKETDSERYLRQILKKILEKKFSMAN